MGIQRHLRQRLVVILLGLSLGGAAMAQEAPPRRYSPVNTGVEEVAPGVLQLWMELAEAPVLDPDPERSTTYQWFLDTDCNPQTGQKHGSVGSECNVRAVFRNHVDHGGSFLDDIAGQSGGPLPMAVVGKRVTVRLDCWKIRYPRLLRWNCEISGSEGPARFLAEVRQLGLSYRFGDTADVQRVVIEPMPFHHQGLLFDNPTVWAYASTPGPLALRAEDEVAYWIWPDFVRATPQGLLAAAGRAGWVKVTAVVNGILSCNTARIMVGTIATEPAVFYRRLPGDPPGHIRLRVADAAGSPIPLAGHQVQWRTDPEGEVRILADGTVEDLPGAQGKEAQARFWFDGTPTTNECLIRALDMPVELLEETALRGQYVTLWFAPVAREPRPVGLQFAEMTERYDYLRTLDAGYEIFADLVGTVPPHGGTQEVAYVYSPGGGGGCSGNPIIVGCDPVAATGSAQTPQGPPGTGLVLHEMHHEFTAGHVAAHRILWSQGVGLAGHGITNCCAGYALYCILSSPDRFGVAPIVAQYLADPGVDASYPEGYRRFVEGHALPYLRNGAHFAADFNPDIASGMWHLLADRYGWAMQRRFNSVFWPPDEDLDFKPVGQTQAYTFLITAMSAGARTDLRGEFRKWGLPCDDALYARLLPWLSWRAAQRDEPLERGPG